MSISLSKKDVIWSYIGTILSMGANFLLLPVIVYFLDANMLGIWYVFLSIGAIAALFDFGFAVTFSRNITYAWSGADRLIKENVEFNGIGSPNYDLLKKILLVCKFIYGIIAGSVLLLMLTVGSLYIDYISLPITGIQHFIAWIIYSIAVFLNLYYGYYSSFLRGVGAVTDMNKNTVIARCGQIIITVIFLVAEFGIIGVSLGYLFYGVTFRVLGKYKFYKYCNIGVHLKKIKTIYNKTELKSIFFIVWHNAWRDGLISITNYFCCQVSVIFASLYLSLSETGAFSLGTQIATAVAVISSTLYIAYQPQLQSAYINKEILKLKKTMAVIVISFIILFLCGTFISIIFINPFLKYIKDEVVLSNNILLSIFLYQFIINFRNLYTSYFSCTNRIIYLKSFIASSLLSIILTYIFLAKFNLQIYGIILGPLLSQSIFNVWYWPLKTHKELGITLFALIKLGFLELLNKIKVVRLTKKGVM